jgi:hypothetical protein
MDIPWVHLLWNTYYLGRIPHYMEPVGSFWWKDVCKLMPIFRGFATSTIGDGLSTLFWKDDWLSGVNTENFPRAYSFASNEDVSVQSFLADDMISSNFWLPLSPQGFEEVKDLQSLVDIVNISSNPDSWASHGEKSTHQASYTNIAFTIFTLTKVFYGYGNPNALRELNFLVGLCFLIGSTPEICSEEDIILSTLDTSA